jgi:hypothetical protein
VEIKLLHFFISTLNNGNLAVMFRPFIVKKRPTLLSVVWGGGCLVIFRIGQDENKLLYRSDRFLVWKKTIN